MPGRRFPTSNFADRLSRCKFPTMYLATSSQVKNLLYLSFIEHVTVDELERGIPDVTALLSALPAGCRVFVDFGRLDSMDLDCAGPIGKVMEMCDQKLVALVVRLVPDPSKNIGLNILTLFHYHHRLTFVTCETMADAARALGL